MVNIYDLSKSDFDKQSESTNNDFSSDEVGI